MIQSKFRTQFYMLRKYLRQQECIRVGCVLPSSVAVPGGVVDTPLGRHPLDRHPHGYTPWQTPPGQTPSSQTPPWADLTRQTPPTPLHAGIHTSPAHCMLGYASPCGETYTCENITFPQLQLWVVNMSIKILSF